MNNEIEQNVSTGLKSLDRLLGGGLPSQTLAVVAGPPGSGKTMLAFHMLAQAVCRGAGAILVNTTHQPVAKLRTMYGGLSFLGPTGVMDQVEILELDNDILRQDIHAQNQALLRLLNAVVGRVQENPVGVVAVDSFRAISEVAQDKSLLRRFLGAFNTQLVYQHCIGLLVGEYVFPRDLDLPELAMADVVIYLDVERQVTSDLRTLRIFKKRGGPYVEGRHAFRITGDGLQITGVEDPPPEDEGGDPGKRLTAFPWLDVYEPSPGGISTVPRRGGGHSLS